jgi:hypothetical protein
VCDRRTGRLLAHVGRASSPFTAVAFSPNGSLLAAAAPDRSLHLWDVPGGKLRCRLEGHRGDVTRLAFSADGKRLLSGSEDGTALLWDVAEALRLGTPAPTSEPQRSMDQLWGDLAGADTEKAEAALAALVARPEDAVRLAKRHLRPAAPLPAARLGKLLADLEAEEFTVRDRAEKELERLDELVESALRRALAKATSADLQRRLKKLLERADKLTLDGESLRAVRAVELLERIGSPAARKLLGELAKGAADARLTRDARAALERLGRPGS